MRASWDRSRRRGDPRAETAIPAPVSRKADRWRRAAARAPREPRAALAPSALRARAPQARLARAVQARPAWAPRVPLAMAWGQGRRARLGLPEAIRAPARSRS